ncbi:hypothetical protein KC340_g18906, partial [Hortaea werneckii]
SPSNYTFYPWTLPAHLIPADAVSALIRQPLVSTLTFPNLNPPNEKSAGRKAGNGGSAAGNWLEEKGFLASSPPLGALQKVLDGVLVHSLSNLRLNLVQEVRRVGSGGSSGEEPSRSVGQGDAGGLGGELQQEFRVNGVGNLPLGRDEKVLVSGRALDGVSPVDPHFRRVRDLEMVDLVVDVPVLSAPEPGHGEEGEGGEGEAGEGVQEEQEDVAVEMEVEPDEPENGTMEGFWKEVESLLSGFLPSHLLSPHHHHHQHRSPTGDDDNLAPFSRTLIPAILPTGLGAAAYEGETGSDRASQNLKRFTEAHVIPASPWKAGEKV